MGTVATFLSDCRYDLRDFSGQDFDDNQLISYLNRAIHNLDTELIRLKSDLTFNSGTVTLSAAANSASVPTGCDSIRACFYSQDEIIYMPAQLLYTRRIYVTASGQPDYYCHVAESIQFDRTADDDYSITVQYDKRSTALTATTDSMPYSDRFNQYLREALLVIANKAKKDKYVDVDAQFQAIFKRAAMREVVTRQIHRKPYTKDF